MDCLDLKRVPGRSWNLLKKFELKGFNNFSLTWELPEGRIRPKTLEFTTETQRTQSYSSVPWW